MASTCNKNVLHELSKGFALQPPYALWSHCSEEHNNVAPGESSKTPNPCDWGAVGLSDGPMGLSPEQQSPSFCSTWTSSLTSAHWCGCAFRLCTSISLGFICSLPPPVTAADSGMKPEWVSTVELPARAYVAVPHTLPNVQHLSWAQVLPSTWGGWWTCLKLSQAKARQGRELAHSCSGAWV